VNKDLLRTCSAKKNCDAIRFLGKNGQPLMICAVDEKTGEGRPERITPIPRETFLSTEGEARSAEFNARIFGGDVSRQAQDLGIALKKRSLENRKM